jgi:uncharacterized membrane protein (GlpM family)
MSPLGPRLSLADLAIWTAGALVIWLFATILLQRRGSRTPSVVGALVSWLLARAILFGVPELVRWAAGVLDQLTG